MRKNYWDLNKRYSFLSLKAKKALERLGKTQYFKDFDGYHARVLFENTPVSISIIKHFGSYGEENDLWEAAIVINLGDREKQAIICVVGYLTDRKVVEYTTLIKKLIENNKDYKRVIEEEIEKDPESYDSFIKAIKSKI